MPYRYESDVFSFSAIMFTVYVIFFHDIDNSKSISSDNYGLDFNETPPRRLFRAFLKINYMYYYKLFNDFLKIVIIVCNRFIVWIVIEKGVVRRINLPFDIYIERQVVGVVKHPY